MYKVAIPYDPLYPIDFVEEEIYAICKDLDITEISIDLSQAVKDDMAETYNIQEWQAMFDDDWGNMTRVGHMVVIFEHVFDADRFITAYKRAEKII